MRKKRFRKTVSAFLTAAVLLQSVISGAAAEGESQPVSETAQEAQLQEAPPEETQAPATEAQTQAPATEAQTQAPATEAQTQAPATEAQTQAPATEAQTQAPATEAQTQAPATEEQTQAPVTEAQTQAPATEAQTQAPAAETQTEAPATEGQTQAPAEETQESATEGQTGTSENKTKKKKKETERSDYENAGDKMTAKEAAAALRYASLYLFAASVLEIPEQLQMDAATVSGDRGQEIISGLQDFSVRLADAKSSSDLEVINLYADEEGEIDESQLTEVYEDCVIDVTNKYYVVNVIADKADQKLTFSGYEMKLSGQSVRYESSEQPCDILYNFAAWDDGEFTSYTGEVTLSGDSGLQGIFLAPGAEVKITSDLAGSVYADTIHVDDSVQKLLKNTFAQSTPQAETEKQTDSAEETGTENSESESDESEHDESESVTEAVTENLEEQTEYNETNSPKGDVSDDSEESETGTEAAQPEETAATEDGITDEVPDIEVADTEVILSETEIPDGEEEIIAEAAAISLFSERADVLAEGISAAFTVNLTDGQSGEAVAGTVTVRAAQELVGADGNVICAKNAEIESAVLAQDEGQPVSLGAKLTTTGHYYLEVTQLPAEYLDTSRIYFSVNEQGLVCTSPGWDQSASQLSITLYKKETSGNVPVLEVTAEDGTALGGAVFVVKDKDGNLIRNAAENGYPQYYIRYDGTLAALAGLEDGEYILSQIRASDFAVAEDGTALPGEYQVADDVKFTVPASEGSEKVTVVNQAVPAGKKLTLSAQAYYSTTEGNADTKTNVLLTAEESHSYYVALFQKTEEGTPKRVSGVQELTIAPGQTETAEDMQAVIPVVSDGAYYIAVTDEFGELPDIQTLPYRLQETDSAAGMTQTNITFSEQESEKSAVLQFIYQNGMYPDQEYSYMADLAFTLEVLGRDNKALSSDEIFYAAVYSDEALTESVLDEPVEIAMGGNSVQTITCQVKMTSAEAQYYIAETDRDGKVIRPEDGFAYAVTYPDTDTGAVTVSCGITTAVKIRNKLNDSVVKLRVESASGGALLPGAVLAIKNSSGRVIALNNTNTFESKDTEIRFTNLLEEGTKYYLSEIQAPEGYTPAPDVSFTVKKGSVTEVVLKNTATAASDYQLTVSKQVYAGDHQVYAYDNTNKSYSKAGAYTFYAALFSDARHTKKVSDVQKITVSGFGGTTVFKNLEHGKTYYLAETTAYGEVYKSSTQTRTIKYSDGGEISMTEKNRSAIIQNVYNSIPAGYRYTGTMTIKKQVVDTAGEPLAVKSTFYAGIYRTADYSDQPTIVKLQLDNTSTASVKRRILLSGDSDMTYYIAELDSQGNRITDESEFSYTVSIDQPQLAVSKSQDKTVTITNKVKSSKATLYLTKKVYEGASQKKVNETFYAGLFKDAEFKELYTKPIPLKLENKSEITLKLTLNLGKASAATIYVAEVDKDGKVIRNQRDFGYEVRVINSTAAFTQEKLEIQTILINSVYGTSSESEWNDIYSEDGNNEYGGYFSGNGEASWDDTGVATGDDTPVMLYLTLLGASVVIIAGLLVFRRRRRGKRQ